jgi:ankyrin repeat protein
MEFRKRAFYSVMIMLVSSIIMPAFSQLPAIERDAQGNTPLHLAIMENGGFDGRKVADLIAAGADVNATNFAGQTPLHLAVAKVQVWNNFPGANGPVQVILKAGANVNAQDNEGLTPLHETALSDSMFRKDVTQALLEAGANPNARDKQGRTPVHLFLTGKWPWTGASESLAFLAAARADFSAKDNSGKTPLHYLAALGGQVQSPFLFIQNLGGMLSAAKVDYSARDNAGDTPLHVAARHGSKDVYDWLIQNGASLDATNNAGETPRQLAGPRAPFRFDAELDIYQAAREGNLERVKALLKSNPALLNQANQTGETPLRAAATANRTFVVDFLVQAGALWDVVSATAANRGDELRSTLSRSPSVTSNGTLLQVAATHNADITAEILIAAGADLNVPDKFGLSPFGAATLGHHKKVAEVFREHGAKENIFDADYLNDLSAAQGLLAEKKSLAQATNASGITLVTIAAAMGHDTILALLLDNGAPLEADGTTPLHAAAKFNQTNAVELLMEHGAVAESFDSHGLTPLQVAVMNYSAGIAQVLLKHRSPNHAANPDTQASLPLAISTPSTPPATFPQTRMIGDTAMHFAAINSDTNMIAMLLQAGASVNIANEAGQTPLDLASGPRRGPPPSFWWPRDQFVFGPAEIFKVPKFNRPASFLDQQAAAKMLEDAGAKHSPNYQPFGIFRPRGGPTF